MRKLLTDYTDEPVYNMKAVEQQTTIPAATLRAWERRYLLMEPKRTTSGYRLYSERDVALLHWVRNQMNEGLTISRVVAKLDSLRASNEPIWIEIEEKPIVLRHELALPPRDLVAPLYQALIALDEYSAGKIIEQAFALYAMQTVSVEIIRPVLVEIGEAWHRGDILIATEHFASTYLRGRLLVMLQAYIPRPDMPMIFVGCAPSELHEGGALIFALMLRQQGYNVIYLGQDVPIDDIVKAAQDKHPAMICMAATSPITAGLLHDIQEQLAQIEPPAPIFAYGGQAFDTNSKLRESVAGYYLGSDPRDSISLINDLLRSNGYPHKAHL
ncbi:MAG: MerR family transcriptional regulator [Chloroflexota bacterium]